MTSLTVTEPNIADLREKLRAAKMDADYEERQASLKVLGRTPIALEVRRIKCPGCGKWVERLKHMPASVRHAVHMNFFTGKPELTGPRCCGRCSSAKDPHQPNPGCDCKEVS